MFQRSVASICLANLDKSDSNFKHRSGGLTKYKSFLFAIGGFDSSPKSEIMEREKNGTYIWSEIKSDFEFFGVGHSLVTVPPSDINEEYVLLIGGMVMDSFSTLKNVYKFNGTWFYFGTLNSPRSDHSSIFWNGAVYVIGGLPDSSDYETASLMHLETKMEIWKIKDSPDQFKTTENWPELNGWSRPHLFIVPDTFFPDY